MLYNFLMTLENGIYSLISMDYKIVVEGTNKSKLVKKAEKRRGSSPRIRMSNIKRFD